MAEHSVAQRLFAEFIGTALLVFVGAGSVPAILLLESGSKAPFSGADLGFISVAFGLIIVALVYTVGKVSGCHINPAVTFAMAATKRFPWSEVPTYWAAQVATGAAANSRVIIASATIERFIFTTFQRRINGREFRFDAGGAADEQCAFFRTAQTSAASVTTATSGRRPLRTDSRT